jgi:hypothetical protein
MASVSSSISKKWRQQLYTTTALVMLATFQGDVPPGRRVQACYEAGKKVGPPNIITPETSAVSGAVEAVEAVVVTTAVT